MACAMRWILKLTENNSMSAGMRQSRYQSLMQVGRLPAGPRDSIADVAGVHVGHCTLNAGAIQTGVTVLRVHGQSHYMAKVPAAATVLNGFGKSVGLM